MLLFTEREGEPDGRPDGMAEMKAYAGELAARRVLQRGAPLERPSASARKSSRDSG
jgi:hypothetical protein